MAYYKECLYVCAVSALVLNVLSSHTLKNTAQRLLNWAQSHLHATPHIKTCSTTKQQFVQ